MQNAHWPTPPKANETEYKMIWKMVNKNKSSTNPLNIHQHGDVNDTRRYRQLPKCQLTKKLNKNINQCLLVFSCLGWLFGFYHFFKYRQKFNLNRKCLKGWHLASRLFAGWRFGSWPFLLGSNKLIIVFQKYILQNGYFSVLEYGLDDRTTISPISLFLNSVDQVSILLNCFLLRHWK
jgi:hypothetical protein